MVLLITNYKGLIMQYKIHVYSSCYHTISSLFAARTALAPNSPLNERDLLGGEVGINNMKRGPV